MLAGALLIFAVLFILDAIHTILVQRPASKLDQQIVEVKKEARELRQQAAALSSPATFAQSAKVERRANALQSAAERLAGHKVPLVKAGLTASSILSSSIV